MHKFGQDVAAPGMLAAYRTDLADTVCKISEASLLRLEALTKNTTI